MKTCIFDFETRSDVDLRGSNVYVYSESPHADVWALAYCFDEEPVKMWYPGLPAPNDLFDHVRSGGLLHAHNIDFDRRIWNKVCVEKYGFPALPVEQCRCTMAMALSMNLPAGLDNAAAALKIEDSKDAAGGRIMLQLAKPRRVENGVPVWWDEEEFADKYAAARAYCAQDVNLTRKVLKRLLPLNDFEQKVWEYHAKANDRGIFIDTETCVASQKFIASAVEQLNSRIRELSGGRIAAITNVGQITEWLAAKGLPMKSIARAEVTNLLNQAGISEDVREVLELRLLGSKSSVAKIQKLLKTRSADGRVRGTLQYWGAHTGRVAHRGAQPGNLPKPLLLDKDDDDLAYEQMESIIGLVRANDVETTQLLWGSPLQAVADTVRGLLTAAPGNELFDFDLANIEGRVLPWLAGHESLLEAFRAYDAGTGPDLYKVTAGGVFGITPDKVTKAQRNGVGKPTLLSLGYQGGPGALVRMARSMGVNLVDYIDVIMAGVDAETIQKAQLGYLQRGSQSGMLKELWVALECVKLKWRAANPLIQDLWFDTEAAAIAAVANPKSKHTAGGITWLKSGSFLFARLPSNRCLCYPYPRLFRSVSIRKEENAVVLTKTIKEKDLGFWTDKGWEHDEGASKVTLFYQGTESGEGEDGYPEWKDIATYGGKLIENVTQAVARDVMVEAQLRLEAAGYPVVLTVHDEILSERKKGEGSLEEYLRLAAESPAWAKGLPLAVAGWQGHRFRK